MNGNELANVYAAFSYLGTTVGEWRITIQILNAKLANPSTLDLEDRAMIVKSLERLRDGAISLEVPAATSAGKQACIECVKFLALRRPLGGYELQQMISCIDRLMFAFVEEIRSRRAIFLSGNQTPLFESPEYVFGKTESVFPMAKYDIQEAGRCLALGLYTASVFHCMRILEFGIVALASKLEIDLQSNWNAALNLIEKEIRERNSRTHGIEWRQNEAFFSEAATHFRLIKNAWRNHTMHGRESFDQARARAVHQSTADFMVHLTSGLSDSS